MKLSVVVGVVVLIVGGVGALYTYNRLQPEPVPAIELQQQDTQLTVTVTGEVKADQTVSVSPTAPGRITALWVEDGQAFDAGQPLVQLHVTETASDLQAAQGRVMEAQGAYRFQQQGTRPETLAQLKAAVLAAQGALSQAQAMVQKAQAESQFAQAEAARYATLRQKAYVSVQEAESKQTASQAAQAALAQAQASFQSAQAQVRQAQSSYQQGLHGPTVAEVSQALGGLRAAQGARASAQARQEQRVLKVPFRGVVVERIQRVGDLAQPGQAVLKVMNPDTLEVVAHVEEVDLAQVHEGSVAGVILDALPDVMLRGRIIKLGHQVNAEKGTVEARIRLEPEAWKKLGAVQMLSGMTADVNIATATLKHAMVVPTSAVVQSVSGPQVYLFVNQRLKPTAVQIQRVSSDYYALLSGVKPGQWVAEIAQPELLKRTRVKPRAVDHSEKD